MQQYPLAQKILSQKQLRLILKTNSSKLSQYMGRYCNQKLLQNIRQTSATFLKNNYQNILLIINQHNNNPQINNFSMHFSLVLSTCFLRLGQLKQAKHILKKCLIYLQCPQTNIPLLASCLNNLANIQKQTAKHYKALQFSIKGFELMYNYLQQCKTISSKQRIKQDTILLVVLIIMCKGSLRSISRGNGSRNIVKMMEFFNYVGYRTCLKYFGEKSAFIKRFTPVQKEFHLPMFKIQKTVQVSKKQDNQNQLLILKQLQNIYQVLKLKQRPQVIVLNNTSQIQQQPMYQQIRQEKSILYKKQVSQRQVIVQPKRPSTPPRLPEPPRLPTPRSPQPPPTPIFRQPSPQKPPQIVIRQVKEIQKQKQESIPQPQSSDSQPQIMAQQVLTVNKWQIKLSLRKQKNQKLGNLLVQTSTRKNNKNMLKTQAIPQQKLQSLITLLNRQDKLPYQILTEPYLRQSQFIHYNIKPFMNLTPQGQMQLLPKAMGIIPVFVHRFINQDCFVFVNHIRYNSFRVAISPGSLSKSVYLNVQFCSETLPFYFNFQEEINDLFTAVFKSINKEQVSSMPDKIKDKTKLCKVTKPEQLTQYVRKLIEDLQNILLKREQQTAVNEIIANQKFYYRFQQINPNKQGVYYIVRYLSGIGSFDIYLHNNYQSYGLDGKIYARGNCLYTKKDFFLDFNIPIRNAHNNIFAFIQMVSKKYYLLTFQKALTDYDLDRYVQNAILEVPLSIHCHKMMFIHKNSYIIPMTISLVTVNSDILVGLKVSQYQPDTCLQRGYFIHIVSQEWLRPYRKPQPSINTILFKKYIDQFTFRKDYFLAQWLEKKGFGILFGKVMDPNHQLFLERNVGKIVRSTCLISIFNQEDKVEE